MATHRLKNKLHNFFKELSQARTVATPALPEDLSQFDTEEIVSMFKMMAIIDHGDSTGWEKIRSEFIKKNVAPNQKNQNNINATLASQISAKNVSKVDQVMNDMSMDTNQVIEQISEGTVSTSEGKEELDKMAMIEGDMPGQGKHKQGNWRG